MTTCSERTKCMESPSKRQRTNFFWSKDARMALLKLCVEYKDLNGQEQLYKWGAIAKSLNKTLGANLKSNVLISRLASIKADYSLWKALRNSETGLGVDPVTSIIVAEPQWRTRKIQERPDFSKFRTTGFPTDMEILCSRLFDDTISRGDGVSITRKGSTRERNRNAHQAESHAPSTNSTEGVRADHTSCNAPMSVGDDEDEIEQPCQTPTSLLSNDGGQQIPRSTDAPRDSPYTRSADKPLNLKA